jgi:ABC-type Fe3+/spermidine/putrescine transport system ATPase subunit
MHDEYRITTVYVTHDQSEAMVTSDRIVVMNRGRIEQIDSPVRLYEMPRTPFVASFIGKTNLLAGDHAGGDVRIGELRLPASRFGRPLATGRLALSMRPQHVRLIDASAQPAPGEVIAEGRVTGVAYLGGSFEYILDLGMGSPVIALSDTLPPLARGERIRAAIDPARIAVVGD